MADNNIAYLQFRDRNCILSFYLVHDNKERKFIITLQIKETVGALLQKSENAIKKSLKHNGEFNLSLWNEIDVIEKTEELTNLITMSNIKFCILNEKYYVEIGQPTKKAELEDVIFSGAKARPIFFNTKNVNKPNEDMFWWFKSKDKCYWKEIGNEYTYMVKKTDVGFYLKFQYFCKNGSGVLNFVISTRVVFKFPTIPYCPFHIRQIYTPDYLKGRKFRFITYNILSPRFTKDQFNYCLPEYLSSGYRKRLLMKELLGYKADIICLQEVDFNVFRTALNPKFKREGYECIYYHDNKPGKLAIFYNPWKFNKTIFGTVTLKSELIKNKRMHNLLKIIEHNSSIFETLVHLETSIQYCEFLSGNDIVIVVNVHLFYLSKERNVRLLQTAVCLEFLKQLCQSRFAHHQRKISVILAGDFNSNPSSSVFEFITQQNIFYNYDYDDHMGAWLEHPFSFQSAYGKPLYTNYTEEFKACLDYIFYHDLKLLQSVPIPDESVLSKDVGLPSAVFPSDHVPLITDFKFC